MAHRHHLRDHQPGRRPGDPRQLAGWIRGHWQIEVLHHIRDASYGEDASQTWTGNGPQAMATLRNLAIGIMKLAGYSSIAATCRHHSETPPGPWRPSVSAQHDQNGHHATMPEPWGLPGDHGSQNGEPTYSAPMTVI